LSGALGNPKSVVPKGYCRIVSDLDRVSVLVQEAMDQFDDPSVALAAMLRRCIRIASLRGDAVNLFWLTVETRDNTADSPTPRKGLAERLSAGWSAQQQSQFLAADMEAWMDRRAMPDGKNVYGMSIQNIEDHVREIRAQEASLVPPQGMTPLDLGLRMLDIEKTRPKLLEVRLPLEGILARTRQRLWEFLIEAEHELTFGEASAETFDRLRSYVDQQLTVLAPPALEQFQAAYRRLKEGMPEARAQAVTSCRRVLKTFADLVYPPGDAVTGADGKTRQMTDDKFINCLLQFVTEAVGSHSNGAVVAASVEDVGRRVAALNDLASKGVHDEVGEYEVDSCVVQTYLVIADMLRIRQRAQDAARVAPPASPGTG
jgi:hypothetical protein